MVIDKLDYIDIYKGLSNDIYEGLKFIKTAKKLKKIMPNNAYS